MSFIYTAFHTATYSIQKNIVNLIEQVYLQQEVTSTRPMLVLFIFRAYYVLGWAII